MRGADFLDRAHAARDLIRERVLPLLLFGTVAAFFVAPSNVALNKAYYFVVAPLTLWALGATDYRLLYRHTTLRWSGAFIAFMTLSAAFTFGDPSAAEPTRVVVLHGASTLIFVLLIAACERSWLDQLPAWSASIATLHALVISAAWYSNAHPY